MPCFIGLGVSMVPFCAATKMANAAALATRSSESSATDHRRRYGYPEHPVFSPAFFLFLEVEWDTFGMCSSELFA